MFYVPFFKKLLLRSRAVDFVEICNICAKKVVIKAAKLIINSDKMCLSYNDLNFGVTFLEHSVVPRLVRDIFFDVGTMSLQYLSNIERIFH